MLNGSILQRLQSAHQTTARPLKFGVYYKHTLVALCHALEDYILELENLELENLELENLGLDDRPLILTAFQRGKWYLEEADRYGDLADRAWEVVIMAQPDAGFAEHSTSQRPNVSLVNLDPGDPVAQEWHLIILAPNYTAMVLCQELSPADYGANGQPKADHERKFYGFWTFEPLLVQETIALALDHLQTYDRPLAEKLKPYGENYRARSMDFEGLSTIVSKVVDYLNTSHQGNPIRLTPEESLGSAKAIDRLASNLVSNEIQAFLRMAQLLDQSDLSNPSAAAEVAGLAEALGQLLDLPIWQLRRLRLAALLHRLDPLRSTGILDSITPETRLSCPLVPGAQVLRKMPQLRAIAQIITHLTEFWDGTGQPAGLTADEIPLESRILGLVAEFQEVVAATVYRGETIQNALSFALSHCQNDRVHRWDPKLLETLNLLVNGLLNGWDLPFPETKVVTGLWLLDTDFKDLDRIEVPAPNFS